MSFISFRDSPHEFIITIGALREGDLQLFFGQSEFPQDGQSRTVHFHFDTTQTWEDLAAFLRLQPSKSQARKNGWSGPIPWGYSELHKKAWQHFYILNLDPNDPKTLEVSNGLF
jgi:hypothetical protein